MKAYLRAKEEGSLAAQDYTFGERAEIWFGNHKENIKSTTQESYRYTLRILEGHFVRRKMDQIKAYDIEQFLKKLRKDGASNSRLAAIEKFSNAFSENPKASHLNVLDFLETS